MRWSESQSAQSPVASRQSIVTSYGLRLNDRIRPFSILPISRQCSFEDQPM